MHERVFLGALPDDILSDAAVQCRNGDKKRDVPSGKGCNICCLLLYDQGQNAHNRFRNAYYSVLHSVLYDCMYIGLPFCTEDIPAETVNFI